DVALQLNLSVNGSIFTGSTIVSGKEDFYEAFLGKVSNKFYSGHIDIKWLETNFRYLPKDVPDVVATTPSRLQRKRTIELGIIRVGYFVSEVVYVGLPEQLEDIWLLFNQQSEAEYVGHEGVIDSVRDGRDARTGSSDAIVWVEETNFVTIVRHGSTTKVGFIGERGIGNFVRRGHDDHPSNFDVVNDAQVYVDIFGFCDIDTRWEARTASHSCTEKGDRYKDEVDGGDEDEDNGGDEDKGDNGDKDEHEGGGEDEENKDNGHDQVEEPTH
ncbi:hypothetical protein Gogos_022138, partial [Gossypium gossypioides]|nr:hypothetical protein [Gossypium gossypioides]